MASRFLFFSALLVAVAATASLPVSPALASPCVQIGGSLFCDGRGAHKTIGRSVIFNNGPAGEKVGSFISIPDGNRSRLTGTGAGNPIRQDLPAKGAAGRINKILDGRGFGAYAVPRAPRFGSLSRSGAN